MIESCISRFSLISIGFEIVFLSCLTKREQKRYGKLIPEQQMGGSNIQPLLTLFGSTGIERFISLGYVFMCE